MKGDNIIQVHLRRRPEGFGFFVSKRNVRPYVMVSQLLSQGTADKTGLVCVGDIIIAANGVDLSRMDYNSALKVLASFRTNEIAELVLKTPDNQITQLQTIFNNRGGSDVIRISKPITVNTAPAMYIQENKAIRETLENRPKNKNRPDAFEKTPSYNGSRNTFSDSDSGQYSESISNSQSDTSISQNYQKTFHGKEREQTTGNNIDNDTKNGLVRRCPITGQNSPVKLRNLISDHTSADTLHSKSLDDVLCSEGKCLGSLMAKAKEHDLGSCRSKEEVLQHATDFLEQYYSSNQKLGTQEHKQRLTDVTKEIEIKGSYELTTDELTFGAKTAWRNAPRCIGRIQWNRLKLFDARHVKTAKGMFDALCTHMKYASNGGNIQSAITVFPQRTDGKHDFRIWNVQLIRYAGYKQTDGSVIGDPANIEFTELCVDLGWKPKAGMFDVLPLVLQANGEDPEIFDIPPELVLEVPMKHPSYPWFEELNLKWFALPAVSMMVFDCGGVEFTAAPFNGWYMGTEVGARDFCDQQRYNITKNVALRMGLDVRKTTSLWQDKALVEVNIAVLHSFQAAGVTIMDHHTASSSFMKFAENEQRLRGGYAADWVWIVPPMSGSLTPVFHQEMLMYKLKPSYEYQNDPWITHVWKNNSRKIKERQRKKYSFRVIALAARFASTLMGHALATRIRCVILYATETGRSESFAKTLCDSFKQVFNARTVCMNDYDTNKLINETLVLIVTSTFGSGDPPENGTTFSKAMHDMVHLRKRNAMNKVNGLELNNVQFSVFALGSSAYPNFCAFGTHVDEMLEDLGAKRFCPLVQGDELCGQDDMFLQWAQDVFQAACNLFNVGDKTIMKAAANALAATDNSWSPDKFRQTIMLRESETDICTALSKLHGKDIIPCRVIQRRQLQTSKSRRETILVRLKAADEQKRSMNYVPGDHVAIFAANSSKLVDAVLARLIHVWDPDQMSKIEISRGSESGDKMWEDFRKIPPCTLRTALTRFIDITTPPSQALLKQFASLSTSDKLAIERLGTDSQAYEDWKNFRVPNLADVLEEFPSLKLSAMFVLTQFPLLHQRFYSISSSPNAYEGEVHATIAILDYRTLSGTRREGLCSSWLNKVAVGETIPCFIRQATAFHMPEDKSLPVILVGPGTGIAPFRSFWQERITQKKRALETGRRTSYGKLYLYFGCRQSDVDNIYGDEIKAAKKEGGIDEYFIAFSREPSKRKTYVQDLLKKNRKSVYETLVNKQGHIYICGDVGMASDVTDTIAEIIRKSGSMKIDQAAAYISQLKDENRFHQDIFGVAFRSQDTGKMRPDPRNQNGDITQTEKNRIQSKADQTLPMTHM